MTFCVKYVFHKNASYSGIKLYFQAEVNEIIGKYGNYNRMESLINVCDILLWVNVYYA